MSDSSGFSFDRVGVHTAAGSTGFAGTALAFNYRGESWGDYAKSHLYASSWLTDSGANPGPAPQALEVISATTVSERMTFGGPTGALGTATFHFAISNLATGRDLGALLGLTLLADGTGYPPNYTLNGSGMLPFDSATISFPVIFGKTVDLQWTTQVGAGYLWASVLNNLNSGDFATVDMLHTVSFDGINLVDDAGSPLPIDITSESGTLYGANGAVVVPEPNTIWLALPALAALFAAARRRRCQWPAVQTDALSLRQAHRIGITPQLPHVRPIESGASRD